MKFNNLFHKVKIINKNNNSRTPMINKYLIQTCNKNKTMKKVKY